MKEFGDDVAALAEQVLMHRRLYYAGQPKISDQEYDAIEDSLRSIAPKHPVFDALGDLPQSTERGGKVAHSTPMLSLAKTYSFAELLGWSKQKPVLGTYKIDGVSLSLNYEDGLLKMAKTRGTGKVGEDDSLTCLLVYSFNS